MTIIEIWEVALRSPQTARADSHDALRIIAERRRSWAISLSHTRGLALVAVAEQSIGVDVEHREATPAKDELPDLSYVTLSAYEQHHLDCVAPDLRPARWLQLWTRKEAVLKAA